MHSIRGEWTKLRSLRSSSYLLGGTVVGSVLLTVLVVHAAASQLLSTEVAVSPFVADDPIATTLFSVVIIQMVVMAIGVNIITSEYATRTIEPTLIAQPGRWRLLTAKALVLSTILVATGTIVGFSAFVLGQRILASKGLPYTKLANPQALRAVIGVGLYFALIGLLSLAVGVLIRNTAGALSMTVGAGVVLPNIASLLPAPWSETLVRFWPTTAGLQVTYGQPQSGMLSAWIGLGLLAGFTAVLLGVAMIILQLRDA